MRVKSRLGGTVGLAALAGLLLPTACGDSGPAAAPAPSVVVAQVKQQTVPLELEFVGTTAAVRAVDIRARVEGYLQKRAFSEGTDVAEGQLLYQIDPRSFEDEVEAARGALAAAKAQERNDVTEAKRYADAVRSSAVSREEYDQAIAQAEESRGKRESADARHRQAQLRLEWATMSAPFDGRIGRTEVNVGNLVGSAGDKTLLTQIVQLDPIYVYFSPSEREAIKVLKVQTAKAIADPGTKKLPVTISRKGAGDYPHRGELSFVDNEFDDHTGTVSMRATFPNPDYTLLPGLVVNVQLHLGSQSDALLIPEEAVKSVQGKSVVLLVGEGNKVEQRAVTLGPSYDGMRGVASGLKAGERVVVQGLQKVRAGMVVAPTTGAPAKASSAPKPGEKPPSD
jgi:RND family efflux transporter MFP subunit